MESCALAVMAKAPRVGAVKTRLCPPLTPAEAAELYHCFLLDSLDRARAVEAVRVVVAYTPERSRAFFEAAVPDCTLMPQQGADLGARMASCFLQLLARSYTGVLVTGSDLPTLPVSYLQRAVELVMAPAVDLVLGPSEDGGYYLIGARRLYGALFDNMAWSTSQVYAETVRRAAAARLRVARLPVWFDIDTPAELERLRNALTREGHSTCAHTRRFFRQHEADA